MVNAAIALGVVAATALVVGLATDAHRIACAAFLVSGATAAAVVLLATITRLLSPVDPRGRGDGAAGIRALATADPASLAIHDAEARRHERALAAVADLHERRAWWMTAVGTLALAASAPVWLLAGPDGPVAGACGTIALLMVALAPLAGLGLCMTAITGSGHRRWSPRSRPGTRIRCARWRRAAWPPGSLGSWSCAAAGR